MNLPLRITFEGEDYTYILLAKSISKEYRLIQIGFNDQEYKLNADFGNDWCLIDATVGDPIELLKAIARNEALRYRF